jgi:hypothetical protein
MTPTEIRDQLETMLTLHGFRLSSFIGPESEAMGAWYCEFRSSTLIVTASQDRTSDLTSICVGSLVRRAPQKQMRGPWSLSHLRGFFDNEYRHHAFDGVADQIEWLRETVDRVLDSDMLNSHELNDWLIATSRVMLGKNRHIVG